MQNFRFPTGWLHKDHKSYSKFLLINLSVLIFEIWRQNDKNKVLMCSGVHASYCVAYGKLGTREAALYKRALIAHPLSSRLVLDDVDLFSSGAALSEINGLSEPDNGYIMYRIPFGNYSCLESTRNR